MPKFNDVNEKVGVPFLSNTAKAHDEQPDCANGNLNLDKILISIVIILSLQISVIIERY